MKWAMSLGRAPFALLVMIVGMSPFVIAAHVIGPIRGVRAPVPREWGNESHLSPAVALPRADWRVVYERILSHLLSRSDVDLLEAKSADDHGAVLILKSKVSAFSGCYFVKVDIRCPPESSQTMVGILIVPASQGMSFGSRGSRWSGLQREILAAVRSIGALPPRTGAQP